MHRRRVLTLSAGVVAALSGCSERSPASGSSETDTPDGPDIPTPSPTDTVDTSDQLSRQTARPAPYLGHFVLWNDDDERHRVGLEVSRDGAVVVDERRDLGPGVAADVENPIETQGVYSVVATVDGESRAAWEWRVSNCDSIEYLQVYVADATVEIRTMRQTVDPHPTC